MSLRTLALAGLIGAGCTIVTEGGGLTDVEVRWKVDSATSAAACTTYGIDSFEIAVSGPSTVTPSTVSCSTWASGSGNAVLFRGVAEGTYTATVRAFGAAKAQLASKSQSVVLTAVAGRVWTVDVNFTSADFGNTGGDAKIVVDWNINGTKDGTTDGDSFDQCEEVGATDVEISIDGKPTVVLCSQKGMRATIDKLTEGAHAVAVRLMKSGTPLTTEAKAQITATTAGGAFIANFPFNSFVEPTKTGTNGTYFFRMAYEKILGCGDTVPKNTAQIVLVKLDGTPIKASVCGPSKTSCVNSTFDPNAPNFQNCFDETTVQEIPDIKWGAYKLRLQGTVADHTICWQTKNATDGTPELDILVGAGASNPSFDHNLERLSQTGSCSP